MDGFSHCARARPPARGRTPDAGGAADRGQGAWTRRRWSSRAGLAANPDNVGFRDAARAHPGRPQPDSRRAGGAAKARCARRIAIPISTPSPARCTSGSDATTRPSSNTSPRCGSRRRRVCGGSGWGYRFRPPIGAREAADAYGRAKSVGPFHRASRLRRPAAQAAPVAPAFPVRKSADARPLPGDLRRLPLGR